MTPLVCYCKFSSRHPSNHFFFQSPAPEPILPVLPILVFRYLSHHAIHLHIAIHSPTCTPNHFLCHPTTPIFFSLLHPILSSPSSQPGFSPPIPQVPFTPPIPPSPSTFFGPLHSSLPTTFFPFPFCPYLPFSTSPFPPPLFFPSSPLPLLPFIASPSLPQAEQFVYIT